MADARPPRNWLGFWLLVGVAVVGAMFIFGWLRTGEIGDNPAIELNTTEIEKDSKDLYERGRSLVEGAAEGVRDEMDDKSRQLPESE